MFKDIYIWRKLFIRCSINSSQIEIISIRKTSIGLLLFYNLFLLDNLISGLSNILLPYTSIAIILCHLSLVLDKTLIWSYLLSIHLLLISLLLFHIMVLNHLLGNTSWLWLLVASAVIFFIIIRWQRVLIFFLLPALVVILKVSVVDLISNVLLWILISHLYFYNL